MLSKAKCLDKTRLPQNHQETLEEYFSLYNDLSSFLHQVYTTVNLTQAHKNTVSENFASIRDRTVKIFARHHWHYYVPQRIGSQLDATVVVEGESTEDEDTEDEDTEDDDMPESVADVIRGADAIVKQYNGNTAGLQGFLDSLELAKTITTEHQATLVAFVKSRLTGPARDCISDATNTVDQIIAALRHAIRTPSSDELAAKLQSITSFKKERTIFCKEMEEVANALKHAYITEGLTNEIAERYAARETKKVGSSNCKVGNHS